MNRQSKPSTTKIITSFENFKKTYLSDEVYQLISQHNTNKGMADIDGQSLTIFKNRVLSHLKARN